MFRKLKNTGHKSFATIACLYYKNPGKKLFVIGITGTDGKTTTGTLLYEILKNSGKKTALISTIGAYIDDTLYETGFHTTTPSAFSLQKYLQKAVESGCEYAIIETTSHALDQNRTYGINFQIGVLTNITHEHLDYHKTQKRYIESKLKLLSAAKKAVVNMDDSSFEIISEKFDSAKLITYSLKNKNADITKISFPFKTNLVGEFNFYNCLAAAACSKEIGVDEDIIKKTIEEFKPPVGRQEIVYDKDFTIVIDFAHTPNALNKMLFALSGTKNGRIIHVFGAAGQRDSSKREEMGKASSTYSDIIILTSEDPRSEPVERIMQQIEAGIEKDFTYLADKEKPLSGKRVYYKIKDRKEAIGFAISLAQSKDIVLITGKGHEQSMNYGHGEEKWSEHEEVSFALRTLGKI